MEYLRKQIESILKQTYENIKIYISDDNSPNPRVAEILKQYEKIDERIIIICKFDYIIGLY